PNLLIFNLDDAGYGDLGANEGSALAPGDAPHFEALAAESLRLTDFHAAASVCTPSRASLLTGRFGMRFGLIAVLVHGDNRGLPFSERTLPEILRDGAGYASAMAGKWHLGNGDAHHPSRHGFDETLTMPWSHDMGCFEPWPCSYGADVTKTLRARGAAFVVEQPAAPWRLGAKYVAFVRGFVDRVTSKRSHAPASPGDRYRPFFVYVATHAPHGPWLPAPEWQRTPAKMTRESPFAAYLDTMAEVDATLGGVLGAFENVRNDTLVVVTSDNGQLEKMTRNFRTRSNGPFAGGKFSPREGGHRVMGLLRWPGVIEAGVSHRLTSQLDLLPTFVNLVAPKALPAVVLDGEDLGPWLFGDETEANET
ncbi:hypothetical protein AURANDRAFT_1628, partial [Aureococcus anophagefferens]